MNNCLASVLLCQIHFPPKRLKSLPSDCSESGVPGGRGTGDDASREEGSGRDLQDTAGLLPGPRGELSLPTEAGLSEKEQLHLTSWRKSR